MLIERVIPTPPPEVIMRFPMSEGWALVAALRYYVQKHPSAAEAGKWLKWAADLDKKLRL